LTDVSEPRAAAAASAQDGSIAEGETIVEAVGSSCAAFAASILRPRIGCAENLVSNAIVVADYLAVVGGAGRWEAGGVGRYAQG
jgi:hypothetical protein